ncbi:MAG TPA: DNA-3-methyladenine glycosylase [Actinomycetota bacterium]
MSRSTRRLPRSFFARPSPEVGPDLLGRILVRKVGDGRLLTARIVEAEAYQEDDPASHSFRGRTNRTEVMFGPPGHAYVYFTYGMHHCMNVVTGSTGEGSAVLLRAAEPLEGLEEMARRRGTNDPRALCSGPGRLCQALGIDRAENGLDLVRGRLLWLLEGAPVAPSTISVGPRVGITSGTERPWRFSVQGDRFVSPARPAMPVRGSN